MTLGEFREKTAHLPDNVDMMLVQTNDEHHYAQVEQVYMHEVTFKGEGIPKKEWAKENCLIVTDEIG